MAVGRKIAGLLLAVGVSGSTGCAGGYLFHHTVRPLDLDLGGEAVRLARGSSDEGVVKHLGIPYSLTGRINFLWSSNAIGEIARKHGFDRVHYADLEIFNVLGIWRQYTVHIYGTKADPGT